MSKSQLLQRYGHFRNLGCRQNNSMSNLCAINFITFNYIYNISVNNTFYELIA